MADYVPAPITADDAFRLTYYMTLDGQRMLTVLHFRFRDLLVPTYATAMPAMANALGNALVGGGFWSGVLAQQSNELHYDALRVQRIADHRDVYFNQPLDSNGGIPGTAAPPNVAVVFNKRTLRVGKHGRGDLHLPGGTQVQLVNGTWNTSYVNNIGATLLTDLTGVFDDTVTGNAIVWGIYDPEPVFGGLQRITDVVPYYTVRTMHRRTVGLGE